jgi:glycosyltransferase involved in cell wall biosynthesis
LIEGGISETRIVLRRNGIDLSEFQTLPAPGAFRAKRNIGARTPLILFLGRISFIKGLDYLVEAFADIADSFPQARLIIAGPDDADGCAQAIRTIVDQRQLTKQITSIGALYGKERLEAFIDADFVVLPSRYESFGNVAAESIACGTPVLVTDTCGIASLVDGAGLVVSSDGLRDGLKRLLGDQDLLAKLRAGCVRVASNLSWDEPINEMEKLYASVIAERAVHAKKTNSEPHWTVSSEP